MPIPRLFPVAALLAACAGPPPAEFEFLPSTPHERYEYAFRRVGLEQSSVGFRWIEASRVALERPALVTPPFREVGYFNPMEAESFGFRFAARRGQQLLIRVEADSTVGELFLDLFQPSEGAPPFRHVLSADSGAAALELAVRRDGEYLLRVQPEMLAAGRYEITILLAASLAFPVEGRGVEAIRSRFGAPRDGGRREHHGVDIFAPRGTPVVASAPGVIRSTRPNNLGGKVVWLRTESGESLYHAHLDSVHVRRGMRVEVGDTLGFVGNSGNARTTPPHLHFGIYARRPTDPFPFVHQPSQTPPALMADRNAIGEVRRIGSVGAVVRSTPSRTGPEVLTASGYAPLRVLAGAGSWFRVRLPDGAEGYVRAAAVEPMDIPLEVQPLGITVALARWPDDGYVTELAAGDEVEVLGRWSGHIFVRAADGRTGWASDVPPVTLVEEQ